jgi:hypothetical protein
MSKLGVPAARKPVHMWMDEHDRDVYEAMLAREKKIREIDTTSEIRRMDKPEDLDVQGWKT